MPQGKNQAVNKTTFHLKHVKQRYFVAEVLQNSQCTPQGELDWLKPLFTVKKSINF